MKILPTLALLAFASFSVAQGGPPPAASSVEAAVAHSVAASNQDKQWQPTPEQRAGVVREALAYLEDKDAQRFPAAYARFAYGQKATVPFEKWERDMRRAYADWGTAEGRTLKKVTWYKNPANAPPGIYAAVDFTSRFSELALHCGFVALQQQMDGSFAVAREEENSISRREMAKLTPEALQRIRAEYRC